MLALGYNNKLYVLNYDIVCLNDLEENPLKIDKINCISEEYLVDDKGKMHIINYGWDGWSVIDADQVWADIKNLDIKYINTIYRGNGCTSLFCYINDGTVMYYAIAKPQ